MVTVPEPNLRYVRLKPGSKPDTWRIFFFYSHIELNAWDLPAMGIYNTKAGDLPYEKALELGRLIDEKLQKTDPWK